MSRRWVIADLHFGHTNVIEYSGRPYRDAEHMTEELIKNWNSVVAKDDIVYVLGDFTLSRRKEYIADLCSRLNGSKVLIMGNHDTRKPADYIECGFKVAVRRPVLLEPRLVLMHEPPAPEDIWYRAKYIFGHVHNKPCEADLYGNCACVSAERINYTPVNLDVLVNNMDPSRGPEFGD